MNAAPLALKAPSVETLAYYHGSSSSRPARMLWRTSSMPKRDAISSSPSTGAIANSPLDESHPSGGNARRVRARQNKNVSTEPKRYSEQGRS